MGDTLVLLNARAGTLIDAGAERVREDLVTSLKGRCRREDIQLFEPRALIDAIRDAARGDYATIIVGGGDGSMSCAAHALRGTDKTLGVLPFGTMNLFARDLGMPANVHDAIAALGEAQPRVVDLAEVNGRSFHSLSGLGFFSQMARAREEVRGHPLGRLMGVFVAAYRAVKRSGTFTLDIRSNGNSERVHALAVLVTNNRFGLDWRRPVLDQGLLEVHIVEHAGALGKLRATADLLTGAWRNDDDSDGIRSFVTDHVVIGRTRRRAWASTDGELVRERVPLRYAVAKRALTVLSLPQPA
jgi:diacylglycerol kinase family enzyme